MSSGYQSFTLNATSFSQNKTPEVPYFSIFTGKKPSRTLFLLFEQYKTPVVPYFSIFDNIRPQPYLAVPYFSIFNNLRPQPYLILAFSIIQDPSHTLFWYFKHI